MRIIEVLLYYADVTRRVVWEMHTNSVWSVCGVSSMLLQGNWSFGPYEVLPC